MTGSGPAGEPTTSADPTGRKPLWWWLTIAGSVVVLAVIGVLVAMAVAGQSPQPGPSAPQGQSESPGATGDPDDAETEEPQSPDPSASEAPIDPNFGEPVADTVVGDGDASFPDGVTARLSELTSITVTGTRAGEVSGPAIRVTVELVNGTAAAISLDAVTVNAYFGAETQPASPFDSETEGQPFTGTLAPGGTARGTYVFSIPEGQEEDIVVTVSKSPQSPLVVFRR